MRVKLLIYLYIFIINFSVTIQFGCNDNCQVICINIANSTTRRFLNEITEIPDYLPVVAFPDINNYDYDGISDSIANYEDLYAEDPYTRDLMYLDLLYLDPDDLTLHRTPYDDEPELYLDLLYLDPNDLTLHEEPYDSYLDPGLNYQGLNDEDLYYGDIYYQKSYGVPAYFPDLFHQDPYYEDYQVPYYEDYQLPYYEDYGIPYYENPYDALYPDLYEQGVYFDDPYYVQMENSAYLVNNYVDNLIDYIDPYLGIDIAGSKYAQIEISDWIQLFERIRKSILDMQSEAFDYKGFKASKCEDVFKFMKKTFISLSKITVKDIINIIKMIGYDISKGDSAHKVMRSAIGIILDLIFGSETDPDFVLTNFISDDDDDKPTADTCKLLKNLNHSPKTTIGFLESLQKDNTNNLLENVYLDKKGVTCDEHFCSKVIPGRYALGICTTLTCICPESIDDTFPILTKCTRGTIFDPERDNCYPPNRVAMCKVFTDCITFGDD